MKKWMWGCLGSCAVCLLFSSCATQDALAKAGGRPGPLDSASSHARSPQPGYYALVPLTVPFDLLTWPIQYFYLKDRESSTPANAPRNYPTDSMYLNSEPLSQPYYPPSAGRNY